MRQHENTEKKMTAKEKVTTAVATGFFAAVGTVLGVIAYYRQWLG